MKSADRAAHANKHAYEKAQQPAIVGYMANWLAQARISDLDSPGAAVSGVLSDLTEARADRNWTATAALNRLRYQHNGIAERTTVTIEAGMSDLELLRRIAGDDKAKLGSLKALLKPATFQNVSDDTLLIEGSAEAAEPDDDGQG
jgi:hypothetical protein